MVHKGEGGQKCPKTWFMNDPLNNYIIISFKQNNFNELVNIPSMFLHTTKYWFTRIIPFDIKK